MLMSKLMIYFYPVISGIILLISFYYSSVWFLSFFAFVPVFYFLYQERLNLKKVFLGSFIFGFVFIGGVASWFWQTLPLDWAGVESKTGSILIVFLVWCFSSLVLSFFIALWGAVFFRFKREDLTDIFLASFLWVLFEYLRSSFFSVFWAGKEALVGPHWSLGFLGYILSESKMLLPLAGVGGVYLLSCVVIFVNILFFEFLKSKNKILFFFLIFFLFFSVMDFDFSKNKTEKETFDAAVLNTRFSPFFEISQKDFFNRLVVLKDLLYQIKKDKENPDIIIFPEDSRFLTSLDEKWRKNFFEEIFSNQEKLIIDSSRTEENGKIQSTLFYFNTKSGITQNYEKVFLMPGGEYLPYSISFMGRFFGENEWLEEFRRSRGYSKGEGGVFAGELQGVKFGALFCSEIMSPNLYRELTRNDSQVLINIASHGIFDDSPLLYKQILAIAKVRAVENNRYFIRAANFTPSFILDNKGQIRAISAQVQDKGTIVYGKVEIIKNKSFYTRFGDWFLLLSFLAVVILAFVYLSTKRTKVNIT